MFVACAQRVFYFPLQTKLMALLGTATYRHLCQHEYERPCNKTKMSDVYDSRAWKNFMGPAVFPNDRIGLLFCVDGIPAFVSNTLSLKPAEFINLSLPPAMRGRAEHMLLLMLLPSNLKNKEQKKYFNFAAKYELHDLHERGKPHTHTHTSTLY